MRVRVISSKHSSVSKGMEGDAIQIEGGYAVTIKNFEHRATSHEKVEKKDSTIFFTKEELEFLA